MTQFVNSKTIDKKSNITKQYLDEQLIYKRRRFWESFIDKVDFENQF